MSSIPKILVVDDEEDILEILRYNLEKEGFQVKTACDGPTAIEKATEFEPNLIILDIMMPGMDGIEVCQKLRSVKLLPKSAHWIQEGTILSTSLSNPMF